MTELQLSEWETHYCIITEIAARLESPDLPCLRGEVSCLTRQRTEGMRKMQLHREGERRLEDYSRQSLCLHCVTVWHAILLRDSMLERLRIERKYK